MSNIKYLTAQNCYGKYCIPVSSKHRISAKTVMQGKIWEEETVNYIIKHASNDIIHAGTYFGDMLPAFSGIFDKVWAFEPNSENFYCASRTMEINNIKNVNLFNAALGEKTGTAELEIEAMRRNKVQKLGGASNILKRKDNKSKSEIVEMVIIDEIIPIDRVISIIHLDIEGYELHALKGAINTIKRWYPILILEIKHDKVDPNLESFLKKLGYKKDDTKYLDKQNRIWTL
jgi:FkbM family methyltransferase